MKTVCKKLLSLMLVAILLVSAVPFQAFADGAYEVAVDVVTNAVDGTSTTQNLKVSAAAGDLLFITKENLVAWGYENDNATGYTFSSASDCYEITADNYTQVITVNVTNNATSYSLTLDANGGTVDGGSSKGYTVNYNQAIAATIPDGVKSGYTFQGWFENSDGTGAKLTAGQTWTYTSNKTFYAYYTLNTSTLQIKAQYYVNNSLTKTAALSSKTLAESQFVLEYLYSIKNDLVTVPAGYSWNGMFYDHNGTDELTQQDLDASAERSVVVKFTANTYTLSFNANGGSVSPTTKTVTYDAPVGTLPTPTKKGGVFSHWEDENGNVYTASTVYKVAGNTQLIARWKNEAKVALAIHTDTTSDPIYVQMNGYVAGDEITRSAVESIVTKYYSGSSMRLSGLYTDAAWADYVAGKKPTAEATFTVTDSCTVHVLVSNATLGGTTSTTSATTSSSTETTKAADSTNPQTGDMIGVALAAMMSTGGAALTLIKKRKF